MNLPLPDFPTWTCPHCLGPNEAFGPARCQHCGLHMLSEQEHQIRIGRSHPAAEQIQKMDSSISLKDIQPLLKDLSLLERLQPEWVEWLKPVRLQVKRREEKEAAFQRQWRLHLLVLGLLILAPILARLVSADGMLVGLLCLPIAGWAWIGLFEFRRQRKP